ncbi:AbrB/MazE/SpoVT family DNA-binding domain-containing protein [Desulfolucanica intricata]|uniref:AbrB/MazE/SpoVT family DNA-binding domain-containing protein n=1 Tax=Desulfolucanica intricata TaxID=1285191 RepID=UPI00082F1A57|nr:AbrB/MazE/SpoVT family DNA-binding domain-containing protein [Desulfolucanica intricata]
MNKIYTPKIGSKGQMTLPKEVRDILGLKEGDRLLLKVEPEGRVVLEKGLVIPANTNNALRSVDKG